MHKTWRFAGIEPNLDDVFADPVIQVMMERDCLGETQLRLTITTMQRRRQWREALPCVVRASAL